MRNLVKKYEELGVKLWVEEGSLKFRAPKGVITEERKKELKENKEKIINFLAEQKCIRHDEEGRYEAFPLTDIQAAYLVGRNEDYGFGGVGCKVYLELKGKDIQDEKLNEAWKKVINRHDMMRAIVKKDGTQKVLKKVEIPDIRCISKDSGISVEDIRKELSLKNYESDIWPLYDLCLVHEQERDVLCFSIDMLIADFTSITILLNELELIYNGAEIKELSNITFRDVIMDKQGSEEDTKVVNAKKYWMDRIESLPEAPELPVLNKDPKTTEVYQKNLTLSYKEWNRIEAFAKKNNLTPTSIVLNVYADIFSRWSTDSNFTINVTMADRRHPKADVSGLVGDFTIVNLLEVRQDAERSFMERAERIQQQLWRDLENTAFSGVSVIREIKRVKETESLFPVVFTSTLGYKAEKSDELDKGFELIYKISQTPQVWIDCQVSEEKNGILINWDVRKGVFPKGMIDAAFAAFYEELRALADMPEKINEYHYENSEEVKRVRATVNNTKGVIPTGLLQDEWLTNVQQSPDSIAIIENDKSYTYRQLYSHASQIANALLNKNVTVGTVVAVDMEKSMWSIAAALGILLAGCVYLPLDVAQPLDRRREILEEAGTSFGVFAGETELFGENGIDICSLKMDNVADITEKLINVTQDASNPAYIIFTSGSTKKPKGVVISHKAAKNTIVDINERFHVTKEDKVLALARSAFDLSIYDIFGTLTAGGVIVLPQWNKQKEPEHWYELISKYKVTVWNSVPAQMQMLIMYASSVRGAHLPLKLVLLSGDWIPITLPEEIYDISDKVSVVSLGGATEASIWSNYYVISKGERFERSIPYGKPLKNQFFYVLDKNLEHCPDWVAGELYIGGVGLAEGYKNNEQETAASFIIHPVTKERIYKTGDMGRYMSDGNIEFLGRVDNQVKIRGHRIELQEIENKLKELEGVSSAVVTVRKKDERAVGLNAFVELEQKEEVRNTLVDESTLGKVTVEAGNQGTKEIDRELFQKWTKVANITALYDIFVYLKSEELFIGDEYYSLEEIYEKTRVHDYYKQLIRRWIKALCQEKFIAFDPQKNAYKSLRPDIKQKTSEDSWTQWWEIENKMNYGKKLVEYFQDSSNHLPQLVRGEIDALDIFFPQGDFTIAKAAYHDNLLSSSLNKVIIGTIHYLYEEIQKGRKDKTLNILEIGAGVGGASLDVIPALAGYNVSYMFSDVSQYFLNAAKKNFEQYDFVTYGLFDINKPYWEQGIRTSQFDLIICNNVLHNARSLPAVLQSFREILSPGGAFIIEDTTGENYSLLTSMEFHAGLSQFEDFRKESNEVFVTREQWRTVLGEADANVVAEYPGEKDPLAEAKQVVFVGQFINHTNLLTKEEIVKEISEKLPEYMVPNSVDILDKMPLNANGKLDRKKLASMVVNDKNKIESAGNELKEGLETQIGDIWKKALNRESIYRDENFYKAGGDSLLLAQIVSQMKEKIDVFKDWEWNLIMTSIIQNPTIAGIAEKASVKPDTEDTANQYKEETPDIKMIKKVEASDRVIVLFHDGTGTLSPYDSLVPYLKEGSRDSVVGVYVSDSKEYTKYDENTLLKELGIKYAEELKKLSYDRFCLVGYCMGGLVAVETAKNLIELGVTVEPVITIDTTPADARIRNDILMERTFGMLIGADLTACGYLEDEKLLKSALLMLLENQEGQITVEDLASLEGEFAQVGENTKMLLEMSSEERIHRICDHITRLNQDISTYQYEQMKELYGVLRKSFAGMSLYGNEFFTGDVVALNCSDKTSNFLPVLENRNQEFWESIALGELNRVTIEGNHISCMQEPLVRNIVEIILSSRG